MKVAIIGQGTSGLFLALLLVSKKDKYEITIFDQNINPGRKLYVTGNGRCNLANKTLTKHSYNDMIASRLVKQYSYIEFSKFLRSIGIGTRFLDDLVYPYSLSAKAFTDYMIKILKDKKVKFVNKEKVLDYIVKDDGVSLLTKEKTLSFDKVVVATGGLSHKVFGSDGNFFSVLKKHKYKISDLKPGLAPIRVIENVKQLENERFKATTELILDNESVYKESGEVLFKKDGLSGICIFNISSVIARDPGFKKATIKLDLFPEIPEITLFKQFERDNKVCKWNFLEGYFNQKSAEYIRKQSGCKNLMYFDNQDLKRIVKFVKNMSFTYKSNYGFDDSQVTVGGVDIKFVNENFASTIEKNCYLLGEVLNFDGLCGGYNLMLCFAEARKISEVI